MFGFGRIFFGWVPRALKRLGRRDVFLFRRRVRVSESSGEREVRVEVDTSVQLRSISRKFWRFW